jgi:hypothetical protein
MSDQIQQVNLINFGAELHEKVVDSIEKEHNIKVEQINVSASLNLKKYSTYIQVHDLVERNRELFFEKDFFILNLPGLPIFSAFLITEIHALTGKFPIIVECLKDYSNEGIFSHYKFKRLYDLDRERVQSRERYKTTSNNSFNKDN